MKQTSKNVATEIRNSAGKLAAKYYGAKGVIEIRDREFVVQIVFPPGTKLRILTGRVSATK